MKSTNETIDAPHHLLLIDFGFRQFVEDNCDIGLGVREVEREKISNETIVRETLKFCSEAEKCAKADIENIKKCTAFISKHFPHVIYSFNEDGIDVNNLTEEEMQICSREPDLNFQYWLIDDQLDPMNPVVSITKTGQQQKTK